MAFKCQLDKTSDRQTGRINALSALLDGAYDGDVTFAQLAERLGLPQVTFASANDLETGVFRLRTSTARRPGASPKRGDEGYAAAAAPSPAAPAPAAAAVQPPGKDRQHGEKFISLKRVLV